MNWLFWFLLAWLAVCAISSVVLIGKDRTKADAALSVAECCVVILLIVIGWPR